MKTMAFESRFARPEWERRFLLDRFPTSASTACVRQIVDRYITGTSLRLRQLTDSNGAVAYKLTQKRSQNALGAFQGQLTTIYLAEEEYNVFAALPARLLEKTRYSVPPFGIDIFEGSLKGLIMAEAEFSSAEEAAALQPPAFVVQEVTSDSRFTGGSLCVVERPKLVCDLEEFGIVLESGANLAP